LSTGSESAKFARKMRYSAQIRGARALLGWSQEQLAKKAGIGWATLRRIEQKKGIIKGNFSTILKIQRTFEQAGIHFIENNSEGTGVLLKKGFDDRGNESEVRLREPSRARKRK
jgi:ribosome-binding protein aMBF1 (putative translation factor)